MGDVAEFDSISLTIRENLSKWEDDYDSLAPLSSYERDSVIEIATESILKKFQCGTEHIKSERCENSVKNVFKLFDFESSLPEQEWNTSKNNPNLINNCKMESSQQFLNWYATIEEGMEKEQDCLYQEYVLQLEEHRHECRTLLLQLTDALENLENLYDQYTSVSTKTSTLHTDCEHLLAEQTRLSNGADTIESKLSYYLEVDKISQKLNSPAFHVNSDGFIPLISKIDECINYMTSNPTFCDSSVYLAKYKHCLNRALGMAKLYITKSLENSLQQVLIQPRLNKNNSENAQILYYGKFRMNAPKIKMLMMEIEDRIETSSDYSNLLNDCHSCYFTQRKILLEPCVSDAISQLMQKYPKDYCSLVRSGCAFLVHVCEDEYSLYYQFFSTSSPELEMFVHSLCSILYDSFRPLIIHIDHLETLSELCNILRRGIIEEQIQNNPVQLSPLTMVVNQLLEDCQERLVYRANIYIQADIQNFSPSPGDLAYPSKLEMMERIAESLSQNQKNVNRLNDSLTSMTSIRSSTSEEVASINSAVEERISRVGSSPADLHGMWYPTVRRTLMCLSKVYRSVDRSIFQGVCSEALTACILSLSTAATSISKKSPLDAHLFEIKHLLILREQLAPFQVDASLCEMSLDWSKLKNAAIGLVQKRNRLFSLTSNNALLEFILEGTPQVMEHVLDSKRDVDNQLKMICERLISTCSESMVSPLSTFIAKASAFQRMNKEKSSSSLSLRCQPFSSPDKVGEIVSMTEKKLRKNIPSIQKSLELYLANKETEFILFKPIRTNVLSTFENFIQILMENFTEEDRGIIACPSKEEIASLISLHFRT